MQQSDALTQSLLNALPANASILDEQGIVIAVNDIRRRSPWTNRLVPLPQDTGSSYLQICDAAAAAGMAEARRAVSGIRDLLAGSRHAFHLEYPCESADEVAWFVLHATRFREEQSTRVLVIHEDITERKFSEVALRESEQRFRQLAETIREVFWLTDWISHRVIYVSPAYETIWGRSRQALYDNALDWVTAIHPDDRQNVQDDFFNSVARGGFDHEYRIVRPDGSIRWIRDRGFPILDDNQRAYRIAGIAEDITQHKQYERQLLAHEEQHRALAAEVALAEQRERRRIAIALHDSALQNLGVSDIKLGPLIAAAGSDEQRAQLIEIRALVEESAHNLRSLLFDLSPPVLYELGFEAAIEWLGERVRELHGFDCTVHDDRATKPLTEDTRVVLFQLVRDVLAELGRHIGSVDVDIAMARNDGQISVVIDTGAPRTDAGEISDQSLTDLNARFLNLRERAETIAGSMQLARATTGGIVVTLLAPLALEGSL